MNLSENIVACICEGNTEKYLISLLLEQDALVFNENQLLDGILQGQYRNPDNFASQYLTMDYEGTKVVILIIQDGKSNYKIKQSYRRQVEEICLVVTSPEIEMLMVHSLGLYDSFQKVKSFKKPSIFLAEHLGIKSSKLKSKTYIYQFFSDYSLINAIKEHAKKTKGDSKHYLLADLLKD